MAESAFSETTPRPNAIDSLLLEVVDTVNTTLELETLLRRLAELVRRVIRYDVFAILLLNRQRRELRIRFQVGHEPQAAKAIRVKLGEGITGQAAARGEAVLVNDVRQEPGFLCTAPHTLSELAVPLIVKGQVIGVIDVEAAQLGAFSEEHRRLLTLIASRVATGVENARLYARVRRQAKQLALLNQISRELTSILNLDQLFRRIGELLAQLIDFQMFSILLLDARRKKLQHRFSLRFRENVQIKHDMPIEAGLVGYAVRHNEAVVVADVTRDARYVPLNPETASELCVPLVYQGKVIGALDLEHTARGYFNEQHERMMKTLAAQVAIAIENARLYEKIECQEQRLEKDLLLARELQHRLLPDAVPQLHGATLAARTAPARTVGGDFFDFLPYANGVTALAVADVSGKGAPASIYAALASGILRAQSTTEPRPASMLAAINRALRERPIAAQFVSILYALWDERAHTLRLSNSGLPYPLHCRQGRVQRIEIRGIPLGLFATTEYDEISFPTRAGDVFLFFTDGIPDARNETGGVFGMKRLARVLEKNSERGAAEIVTAIFADVSRFVGAVEAFDDQTVVALKIKEMAENK